MALEDESLADRNIPYGRWESFGVYGNGDGTWHVLVVAGGGGYVFADRFNSEEEADWACALFNAAIGYRPPRVLVPDREVTNSPR